MLVQIDQLEDSLVDVEMKLSDALLLATNDFQEKVKKIIEDMKSKTGTLYYCLAFLTVL